MNLYVPSNATSNSKLPVWVYIQGGGYTGDDSANFNGTQVVVASGLNLIQVNFNYRVGAFGFLASQNISSDGDLNAGLLDQRQALHWVQQEIAAFGGDPDHVIIHGASAGAGSIAHHLMAYGGRNDHLFIGAVAQSPYFPGEKKVADLEWQFQRFANLAGCGDASNVMTCLRSQNTTTLQSANYVSPYPGQNSPGQGYFGPTVDGDLLPDYPVNLLNQGKFLKMPLIVGDEPNEGTVFVANASSSVGFAGYFQNCYPQLTHDDTASIEQQYPLEPPLPRHAAYFPSLATAYGEATFICPGIRMCSAMSNTTASSVWNYSFNVTSPAHTAEGLGVVHTFDTSAIFGAYYQGAPDDSSVRTFTNGQSNAATVPILMDYYISFVMTLNPNTLRNAHAPEWETFNGDGTNGLQRLRIEASASVMEEVPTPLQNNCHFWSGLAVRMQQ